MLYSQKFYLLLVLPINFMDLIALLLQIYLTCTNLTIFEKSKISINKIKSLNYLIKISDI